MLNDLSFLLWRLTLISLSIISLETLNSGTAYNLNWHFLSYCWYLPYLLFPHAKWHPTMISRNKSKLWWDVTISTVSFKLKAAFYNTGYLDFMGGQRIKRSIIGAKYNKIPSHLGCNHVHLTEWFGFINRHLWLGNFGKCNQGLRARTLWLRYPKSSVMFPFS